MHELTTEVSAHPDLTLALMTGLLTIIGVLLGVLGWLLWPMLSKRVSPVDCNQYREAMAQQLGAVSQRLNAGDREFANLRPAVAFLIQAVTDLCMEIRGNCGPLKEKSAAIIDELLRGSGPDDSQTRNGA